jgi:hypothetical protein
MSYAKCYKYHVRASKLKHQEDLQSKFYTSYPDEEAEQEFVKGRI